MKKVLSLIMVIAMVLSMTTVAFATTFEDIDSKNETLSDVATLLNGLGIITGYEDGTFKPERVVTRAEMAAMLIRAKGYESIANDTPSFTDCKNHWAKGYIALASDLGIINGRGNGIFDPDSTVTYQEAAVMMLRALGYTNESINGGKSEAYNVANYRTKALTLGLFKDFTASSMNAGANRGDIALMLNRNLSNSTVYTNEDGRAVVEKDAYGNAIILLSAIASKKTITVDIKTLEEENLVDMTQYLYQSVEAYIKNDVIVFVSDVNSTVKAGTVSAATSTTITIGTGTNAKTYTVGDANVYYNGGEVTYATAQTKLADSEATLVLDSKSNVVGIIAEEQTDAKLIVNAYKVNSTVINGISLPVDVYGKVDLTNVVVTGAVSSIEDIKANDVVKAYASIGNTSLKLLVVRDSVEGTVIKSNNAGNNVFVDSIGEYRDVVNGTLSLNDAGTFYLDEEGNIFAYAKTSSQSTSDYSIVVEANDGVVLGSTIITYPTIKVMNAKGETVTLTIAKDATFDLLSSTGSSISADVKAYEANGNALKLNENLAAGKIIESVTIEDGKVTELVVQNTTAATNNVFVDSKTFDPASNVVIFNQYTSNETAVYKVNSLEELKAMETVFVAKTGFNFITNAKGEYSVIFITGTPVVAPKSLNGVIAEQQKVVNADGKIVHQLVTYIDGEKVTYLTNEALGKTVITAGTSLVNFTITNDVITKVTPVSETTSLTIGSVSTPITSVTNNTFVNNGTKYFMNDDAAIYVFDNEGEFLRVGATSDIEGLNITIKLFLNESDNKLVDNIVVIAE